MKTCKYVTTGASLTCHPCDATQGSSCSYHSIETWSDTSVILRAKQSDECRVSILTIHTKRKKVGKSRGTSGRYSINSLDKLLHTNADHSAHTGANKHGGNEQASRNLRKRSEPREIQSFTHGIESDPCT